MAFFNQGMFDASHTDKFYQVSKCLVDNQSSLFAWAFIRLFSASQQYFSLTANRSTVLSAVYFQSSERAGFFRFRMSEFLYTEYMVKCDFKIFLAIFFF
jgi:hypothetical protein